IYGVLYASASDSRWHEASHGTAFKTDWMNNALYEIASFMVLRESVPWRWSHTRHHSDTIIVGRDPEIAVPRPPNPLQLALKFINFQAFRRYLTNISLHCRGQVTADEASYIPVAEYPKVFRRARIYAAIFFAVIALCIVYSTWLPLVFVFGPNLYGAWLLPIYDMTQHAALAEDVLDHRLNCRTIEMNRLNRFLYWNMNYHVEHHMFPLVPYHQLPQLHAAIADDCPAPYAGLLAAYREIIPAIARQIREPGYFVERRLPPGAHPAGTAPASSTESAVASAVIAAEVRPLVDGWIRVGTTDALARSDVIRFDHDQCTYAIYRTDDDAYYATDGLCTHGNAHLADGLVRGKLIECAKHNGRFDITDGSPQRAPVCVRLRTHAVKTEAGSIWLKPGANDSATRPTAYEFRVVSNRNVATFIRELVLEAVDGGGLPDYQPGQYLQLDIPTYDEISFRDAEINEPFRAIWESENVVAHSARNPLKLRRNYSLATTPATGDGKLCFNVRISLPPPGQTCSAGVGSVYILRLKPGDKISATGPFGDFLIKDSQREMVYVGGGAGMAPLRSHLTHLFETLQTGRKVSFWYGARSLREVFYADYFRELTARHPNFSFHLALSEPRAEDRWQGDSGFIHEVLARRYLAGHATVKAIEFYLCGPPAMVQATQAMLQNDFGVAGADIARDEF
ncbi:MAG: fatty acid desaturase, partial [Propionivibrio sp.]